MKKILIVDDQPSMVATLEDAFKREGYKVSSTLDPDRVIGTIKKFRPDLITLDIHFGDGKEEEGVAVLRRIREYWSNEELPVIILSGHGKAYMIPMLQDLGIVEHFVKPVEDFNSFLYEIEHTLTTKNEVVADKVTKIKPSLSIVAGRSRTVMGIGKKLYNFAQSGVDLLFEGETGTGKDLLAKVYHEFNCKGERPLVMVDCTTIPENLFETVMFGHKANSFTDAKEDKTGKVADAEGGILFLNEIGDLPLEQQKKLLILYENRLYYPVGQNEPEKANIIILAATNKDLERMVKEGLFRSDLCSRVRGCFIVNPPLKEHIEDLPDLINDFIIEFNDKYNKNIKGYYNDIIASFEKLKWKGNVRELKKCIEVGMIYCRGDYLELKDMEEFIKRMRARDSDEENEGNSERIDYSLNWNGFQSYIEKNRQLLYRDYITFQLKLNNWKIAQTAREIGTKADNLRDCIRRYKVDMPKKKKAEK